MKQTIKDLAVTFVGVMAFLPCMLFMFGGTIMSVAVGLIYGFIFFRLLDTQRGRRWTREFWRSSYRLEKLLLGGNADC